VFERHGSKTSVKISTQRLAATFVVAGLVLAACGGDDDTTSDEPAADSPATDEPAAVGDLSGTIVGAGASSQAAAMQGWQAGFQALYPDVTVEYDAIGSGGGRETFLAGGSDFAGSDAYLDDEEYQASIDRCAGDQGAVNLPHYISPIAVAYNLPSLDGTTLQLSPEVLAGIFELHRLPRPGRR
jgi:phosphate transport system substrate-binding protein